MVAAVPPVVAAGTAARVKAAASSARASAGGGGGEWGGGLKAAALYSCGTVGLGVAPSAVWAVGSEEEERAAMAAALALGGR
jgi:hypothetical protein